MGNTAQPPTISFVEGRTEREIHRDLMNLKQYAHGLDNAIWLSPGESFSTGTLGVTNLWPSASHPDGSTTGTRWSIYLPALWVDANAHVDYFVAEASADAGNFRIQTALRQTADLSGTLLTGLAATLDSTITDAAGAAATPKRITTPTFLITGRYVQVAINRIGADAADTATAALILWGGMLIRE